MIKFLYSEMENYQTETNQKDNSKKNVTFSESINKFNLGQTNKEIKPKSKFNNSNNKDESNDIIMNNEAFIRRHSICLEELGNTKKRMARRYSMRGKAGKEASSFKRKSYFVNEIILGDNNEKIITNDPKKLFKPKDSGKGKKKKKVNLIEELLKFDREQQMKMEEYIHKRRKQKNDLIFKRTKLFKLIKPNNEDDEIYEFMNKRKNNNIKNKVNEKDKANDSPEAKNENNINNNCNGDNDYQC